MLTRSVLAWQLTADEIAIALINIAFAVPMIVIAFPGGVLGDRLNRLALAKVCQVLLCLNETLIFVLLFMDVLELWHLLASCVFAGLIFPIVLPTRTAIVFNLVGKDVLGSATALSMTILNVSRVIGPALMGWLIAQHGMTATYAVASVLFLAGWLFVLPIANSHTPTHAKTHKTSIVADITEGMRYVRDNKPILISLLFGMLPLTLSIPLHSILVLFTETIWHVGEQGLGLAMSVAGLGGTVGAIWIARRGENTKRTLLMFNGALSFAIFLACFSLSSSFYLALLLLFIAHVGSATAMTLNNTVTQLLTVDSQRGRVSSVMMVATGFAPLTVAPIAWFAKLYGVDITLFVAGLLLASVLAAFYFFSPTLRTLDDAVQKSFAPGNVQPVDEIETPSGV